MSLGIIAVCIHQVTYGGQKDPNVPVLTCRRDGIDLLKTNQFPRRYNSSMAIQKQQHSGCYSNTDAIHFPPNAGNAITRYPWKYCTVVEHN